MSSVLPFTPPHAGASAIEHELGALSRLGVDLELSVIADEIAEQLRRAAVKQSGLAAADVPMASLPSRTRQHYRELAGQAVCRLDPMKHRLALVEAEDKLRRCGLSFEAAVNYYLGQLTAPRG